MSQKNPKRKITFIGAGSTVFAKNLLGDILSFPELADSSICLYDIDRDRLATSEKVGQRIGNALGIKAAIQSTTDVGQALDGAAYAISSVNLITITFMSHFLLREKVTRMRWIGVCLIFVGVGLVAARV